MVSPPSLRKEVCHYIKMLAYALLDLTHGQAFGDAANKTKTTVLDSREGSGGIPNWFKWRDYRQQKKLRSILVEVRRRTALADRSLF